MDIKYKSRPLWVVWHAWHRIRGNEGVWKTRRVGGPLHDGFHRMCVVYAKQMNQDLKDQSHDADDVNEAVQHNAHATPNQTLALVRLVNERT